MKFILVTLFFIQLAIVAMSVPNPVDFNETTAIDEKFQPLNSTDMDRSVVRSARGCECTTTTGRCVHQGNYQCYFVNGASIVQCVNGDWKLVSQCRGTCKTLHNDRPYCF